MNITAEDLHDLLSYCPSTGALTWKPRPIRFFPTGRPSRELRGEWAREVIQ